MNTDTISRILLRDSGTIDVDTCDVVIRTQDLETVFEGRVVKLINRRVDFQPKVFGERHWKATAEIDSMTVLIEVRPDYESLFSSLEALTRQACQPSDEKLTKDTDRFINHFFCLTPRRFADALSAQNIKQVRINFWGRKIVVGSMSLKPRGILVDEIQAKTNSRTQICTWESISCICAFRNDSCGI